MKTERDAQVALILKQHVSFKKNPFEPRPIIARVFRTPGRWFGTLRRLEPVAFRVHILMIDMMGCVYSNGSILPYLWLDIDGRLIGKSAKGKLVPVDVSTLTDEDIANLKIGVKGNVKLLEDDYYRAEERMLNSLNP